MASMPSVKNSDNVKGIKYIPKPTVYNLQYTGNLQSSFR